MTEQDPIHEEPEEARETTNSETKPSLKERLASVIAEQRTSEGRKTPEEQETPQPTAPAEPRTNVAIDEGNRDYITSLQAIAEELRTQLDEAEERAENAEKRLQELEKQVLYVQAEFQTYRRRREDERSSDLKYANQELILSLLPVLDNFERALKAAEQTTNYEALIAGVQGTLKQVNSALQKAGVNPIEAVGVEFDPNVHEAIGHAESDEYPPNTVAEEVQRGYTIHDRVLRPALVRVVQE